MPISTPLLSALDGAEQLSPELQRAARWLEDHPDDAAMQTMRECARRAGLAPASFSRLGKALGFDGFDALKTLFQKSVAQAGYTARAEALQSVAKQNEGWRETLSSIQIENTASTIQSNPQALLDRAAKSMLTAQTVHFLGLRASHGVAFHLYYLYRMLAHNGTILQDLGGTFSDQIARLGPGSVLVVMSFHPYTAATLMAAQEARANGAQVIALTDSAVSPLVACADLSLSFQSHSPSYFQSVVGAMAMVEQLAATVAVCGGKKTLASLQTTQDQLERQGVYWKTARRNTQPSSGIPKKSKKERS